METPETATAPVVNQGPNSPAGPADRPAASEAPTLFPPVAGTAPEPPPSQMPATIDVSSSCLVDSSDGSPVATVARPVAVPGYEILGELGRGGMGVVYRARQVGLNRLVALKMILAGNHASPEDLERFRREAEAVALLQHPHVIQIYEVNEVEGRPYFSLEYCPGGSLADTLDGTPWPPAKAAELVLTLARAMHAAHTAGIVHRDLKPANVLLAADGSPRITDFGLAKNLNSRNGPTQTGDVMGTPSYMAPEQAGGRTHKIGTVTDVYALGAILYELLTGRPPFKGASSVETVMQVLHGDLVPPRTLQPRLPRNLETICLQCLRKEPHKRPHSALALAQELERFLKGEPILARRPSLVERGLHWARKRPVQTILMAAGLVFFFGLVLAGFLSYREVQASRANALVEALVKADASEVPRLLEEMKNYRAWTPRRLQRVGQRPDLKESARLRLSLALLDGAGPDKALEQRKYLEHRLLDCTIPELLLICASLDPVKTELIGPLDKVMNDPTQPARARFHATLALARYAPEDVDWSEGNLTFLTEQLLDSSRDDQRDVRSFLKPLRQKVRPHLKAVFRDEKTRTTFRLAAADALADLAGDDPEFLAGLACEATLEQFDSLRPRLLDPAHREQTQKVLRRLVAAQPTPEMIPDKRIQLGKRRAGAAALLVHLGDLASARLALLTSDDPESMTQLVHHVKDRRAPVQLLLEALTGEKEARVRYALLLILGDYALGELAPDDQKHWPQTLLGWYRADPDPGVHSACGWLLRRWGQGKQVADVDKLGVPCDATGKRGWFVEVIAGQPWTFIVCRPGKFLMGSPPSERYRQDNEERHPVTLTRPFALCDRELTWAQAEPFLKEINTKLRKSAKPDYPATRLNHPEAVHFCRWLTTQTSRPGSEQRPEFRLPTEAEWEYACRAGTTTPYSFGSDRELLKHYGRHMEQGSEATALLRPNPWGFFDMHGNVWEWCQDFFEEEFSSAEPAVDPTGPATGHNRVLRGGGWDRGPGHCRSAYRHGPTLDYRANYMGLRVARTLPR